MVLFVVMLSLLCPTKNPTEHTELLFFSSVSPAILLLARWPVPVKTNNLLLSTPYRSMQFRSALSVDLPVDRSRGLR
ncbi:hypothetical protein BC835DRAFT_749730 [Cytidiella melzeri]|nr:hypothetical protein BC835DRAFT_749730 [Cytidiella melzeri]